MAEQKTKRLMRGIRYDAATGNFGVWEQEPAELGGGPARLHLYGPTGVFLATLPFDAPWVDFAFDADTLYVLEEGEPGTGLVGVAAYRVRLPPALERFLAAHGGGSAGSDGLAGGG